VCEWKKRQKSIRNCGSFPFEAPKKWQTTVCPIGKHWKALENSILAQFWLNFHSTLVAFCASLWAYFWQSLPIWRRKLFQYLGRGEIGGKVGGKGSFVAKVRQNFFFLLAK